MKNYKKDILESKFTSNILYEWEQSIPEHYRLKQQQLSSRRIFLSQSIGLLSSCMISTSVYAKPKSAIPVTLNSEIETEDILEPWLTISEVQEHLFPTVSGNSTEPSPGAKDINAIHYLKIMLNTPEVDVDEKNFILKGVGWLDGVANNMFGRPFIKLKHKDRERVLKKISNSESGENWLSTILRYIFEALLIDPVYGGNKNQLGWQWLEHQAGFPRPLANKKYWMLESKLKPLSKAK